jgi:hypothetical protein
MKTTQTDTEINATWRQWELILTDVFFKILKTQETFTLDDFYREANKLDNCPPQAIRRATSLIKTFKASNLIENTGTFQLSTRPCRRSAKLVVYKSLKYFKGANAKEQGK